MRGVDGKWGEGRGGEVKLGRGNLSVGGDPMILKLPKIREVH